MGHFAKVENGIVTQIIVAEQAFINFLDDADDWIQTSYNTHAGIHYAANTAPPIPDDGARVMTLRKNFAGIGYTYDAELDAFIPPKPFNSWLLDESTCLWDAPKPYPNDGKVYEWNEDSRKWIKVVMEEDDG